MKSTDLKSDIPYTEVSPSGVVHCEVCFRGENATSVHFLVIFVDFGEVARVR